jgi:calcium-dependent protein kinase
MEDIKDKKYSIKIIDFGTAKIYDKNQSEKRVIGSAYYIAPEVLKQNYNEKCDLWSCGVIMYILLSGKAPFTGRTEKVIMDKIQIGLYDMEDDYWRYVSSDARDLIKGLLEVNVNKRLSAGEALKHKWFKRHDTKSEFVVIDIQKLNECLENIKKYNPDNKLQQVAIAYLVHNNPHLDSVKVVINIYKILNDNSDGNMTKDELKKSLKKYLGDKFTNNLQDEIFLKLDTDDNGYIEHEEFVRACINKEEFNQEHILKYAFSYFDKDGSGQIDIPELKQIFCCKNSDVSELLFMDILSNIDKDGDNQISFDEFKIMMKKILYN